MFIFAIIGMNTFGHVKLNGALDDTVNFQTFGNSMVLLFRLATAAGWNDVLDALLIAVSYEKQRKQKTNSDKNETNDCEVLIGFRRQININKDGMWSVVKNTIDTSMLTSLHGLNPRIDGHGRITGW